MSKCNPSDNAFNGSPNPNQKTIPHDHGLENPSPSIRFPEALLKSTKAITIRAPALHPIYNAVQNLRMKDVSRPGAPTSAYYGQKAFFVGAQSTRGRVSDTGVPSLCRL